MDGRINRGGRPSYISNIRPIPSYAVNATRISIGLNRSISPCYHRYKNFAKSSFLNPAHANLRLAGDIHASISVPLKFRMHLTAIPKGFVLKMNTQVLAHSYICLSQRTSVVINLPGGLEGAGRPVGSATLPRTPCLVTSIQEHQSLCGH